MAQSISYPVAYLSPNKSVHIADARRGSPHYCFGCDREMVIKRGQVRREHFAHKAGLVDCDGFAALHNSAQAMICQGFRQAVVERSEYLLAYPCSRCYSPIRADIAQGNPIIYSEKTIVEGTRSDLVVTKSDGVTKRVVIEIVVSHDVEPETRLKYESAGIPVVKIKPTFETIRGLRFAAMGYETLNVTRNLCHTCVASEKNESEELKPIEEPALFAKQVTVGIQPSYRGERRIKPITHDKYGAPLRADTRRMVMMYARKLVKLGFQQEMRPSRCSPTLFVYKAENWNIYADLDSTKVVRIWEVNCKPAIYALGRNAKGCRECLLVEVSDILAANQVPCRRNSEDTDGHRH